MTMVERMARAMCRHNYPGASEADIDEMWEGWREDARAALSAMMDATPGMVEAGQQCEAFGGDGGQIYRAMCRAALDEGAE